MVLSALTCAELTDEEKRQDVDTLVLYGIELLEAGSYREFVLDIAHPDDLKKIRETRSLDDLVAKFAEGNSKTTLAAFKKIKTQKPTINADKTKATFRISGKDFPQPEIVFEKGDKYWYLRN